jgi:pimeloyl-ACP methyl ester carboxylesterase
MQKSSFKTNDGCHIYYETHGFDSSKPALIFLNGTMQTTLNWRPHARFFQDRFSIILYDARSQGQSELGEKKLSIDLHVKDLFQLLHYLKVKRTHLAGLSHGALVALAFAAKFYDFTDRLVLCSTGWKTNDKIKKTIGSWLEILKGDGLEALARAVIPVTFGKKFLKTNQKITANMVKAIIRRNQTAALIAQFEAMPQYHLPDSFAKKIKCPALIISGAQDQLVNPTEAKALASLCRGRHKEVSDTGHSIPIESPKVFNKLVQTFLTRPHDNHVWRE